MSGCSAPPPDPPNLPVENAVKEKDDKKSKRDEDENNDLVGEPTLADEPTSSEAGAEAKAFIYAHDPRTLYKLDGETNKFTKVGPFKCLLDDEEVLDIAVSSKGAAYATTWDTAATYSRFLRFEPDGACKQIVKATGVAYPTALSFVPKGTVDKNVDALVGYINRYDDETMAFLGTDYVRIDLTTGKTTKIGVLQQGARTFECSGDIVSLEGGKTYLTVRSSNNGIGDDALVEVNPTTGLLSKFVGFTGFRELWGLAYWKDKAYSFSGTGQVITIDLDSGEGALLDVVDRPNRFYGAAVTPVAPK